MANDEHVALLKKGVDAWNEWRRENRDVRPELSEANLRKADLRGVKLDEANLRRANLSEANLSRNLVVFANLLLDTHPSDLDLEVANIHAQSSLHGADLGEADLRGAN